MLFLDDLFQTKISYYSHLEDQSGIRVLQHGGGGLVIWACITAGASEHLELKKKHTNLNKHFSERDNAQLYN